MGVGGADGDHGWIVAGTAYAAVSLEPRICRAVVTRRRYHRYPRGYGGTDRATNRICLIGFGRRAAEAEIHYLDSVLDPVRQHPVDTGDYVTGLSETMAVEDPYCDQVRAWRDSGVSSGARAARTATGYAARYVCAVTVTVLVAGD